MIHLVNQVFKLGRNNENIFLQLWGALNCSPSVKLNCRNSCSYLLYKSSAFCARRYKYIVASQLLS